MLVSSCGVSSDSTVEKMFDGHHAEFCISSLVIDQPSHWPVAMAAACMAHLGSRPGRQRLELLRCGWETCRGSRAHPRCGGSRHALVPEPANTTLRDVQRYAATAD